MPFQITANSKTPAIVLACGAWHVPEHYEPMVKPLREAGIDVAVPKNQSLIVQKDPGKAMAMDAAAIARLTQQFTGRGKDVVLVMHSYGGIYGSEAVGMINESKVTRIGAGRIRRLVYLAAHAVPKGAAFLSSGRTVPGIETSENGMMTHSDPYGRYYTDVTREHAEPALQLLQPMAASTFTQETSYAGWKDYGIPVTFIICKQDTAVTPEMCEGYITRMQEAGVEVDVHRVEGGHCSHFTKPEPLIEILGKLVNDEGAD